MLNSVASSIYRLLPTEALVKIFKLSLNEKNIQYMSENGKQNTHKD